MKKKTSLILLLILFLCAALILFLRARDAQFSSPESGTMPAAAVETAEPAASPPSEPAASPPSELAAPPPSEPEPEPVYVSDPVFGEEIPQDVLEELQEENVSSPDNPSIVIGPEFTIELNENQGTGGF